MTRDAPLAPKVPSYRAGKPLRWFRVRHAIPPLAAALLERANEAVSRMAPDSGARLRVSAPISDAAGAARERADMEHAEVEQAALEHAALDREAPRRANTAA